MPPIRRFLRLAPNVVLEVRIYLENPSQTAWLLSGSDPALPRIVKAVQPLVLPKLREENERSKVKGKAKKQVKDVVVEDDFEVSVFLTESSARYSVLLKKKTFGPDKPAPSNLLEKWAQPAGDSEAHGSRANTTPANDGLDVPIRQESDDEDFNLSDIPLAPGGAQGEIVPEMERGGNAQAKDKKLDWKVSFQGFPIYGKRLCLVVKKRGNKAGDCGNTRTMEEWVSTQVMRDGGGIETDD